MGADGRIEDYLPLIDRVAANLKRRLPKCVDEGDLVQYGYFGLQQAWEKFDPAKGVKFETYAARRVHGAILDGIRDEDWVPRQVRARKERAVGIGSLDRVVAADGGRERSVGDMLEDEAGADMLRAVDDRDTFDRIVARLPRRHRRVVTLYYFNELTMKEIGVEVGLSESRVSQVHSQAIEILRDPAADASRGDEPIADPQPAPARPPAVPTEQAKPSYRRVVVDCKTGQMYPTASSVASRINCYVGKVCRACKTGEEIYGWTFRYATREEATQYEAEKFGLPPTPSPVRFDGTTQFRQLRCKQLDGGFSVKEAAATAGVSTASIYLSLQSGKPVGVSRLNFWRDEEAMRAEPTNGVLPARSGRPPLLLKSDHRDEPITVPEAAELAGVSEFTVHSAVRRGRPTGPNKMRFKRAGPAAREPAPPAPPPPAVSMTLKIDGVIDRYERMLAAVKTIKAALAEFPELAEMLGLAATLSDEERERRRAG